MNSNTLTLYLVAGAVSFGLCVVLLVGARFQPGTRLLKGFAGAIGLLAAGFVVFGFSASLPRWMTVVGTNMVLLSAGAFRLPRTLLVQGTACVIGRADGITLLAPAAGGRHFLVDAESQLGLARLTLDGGGVRA